MARRRNNDLWDALTDSPWWISVVLAVVVYIGISWVLPSIAGSNTFLRAIAQGLVGVAWIFALPFLLVAAFAAFRSYSRRDLLDSQKGLEALRALSWQNFERLVGEAYRRQGYVVEEVGGSAPDGGIDLVLHRQGSKVIVQCKRWKTVQVGVSSIREFYGVAVAENAERGIFVTTGTFTQDALDFADGKPLELVDGRRLAVLVEGVQAAKPAAKASPAPECPKCGGEMVQRLAKRGVNAGREFWGCRRYPSCTGVRSIEQEAA
jgi:restriction system protein